MEVVYTNENNPATLKLLIAANYAKKTLNLKIVNTQDRNIPDPKFLPCLEVSEQHSIFIANAAARYLYPPIESASDCEEWLEWEATVLAPTVAHIASTNRVDSLKATLNGSLRYLNKSIADKPSLCEKGITICDIAMWSTLYPLYSDPALVKEYLNELQFLLKWLQQLEKKQEFQLALEQYKVVPGITAYQALLNGSKYSLSNAIVDKPSMSESPQHSVEVVTPEEIEEAKQSWLYGRADLPEPKKEAYPVLPVPGEKNVLITSALPYVNNVPHLGNIIGCVLSADVFARFSRLCNYNTLYISGTDEYGTATETKALEEGLTPQQICDKYFEVHNSIYRWFNIGFDYFGRTTTPEQTELVQSMFLNLNENGFTHTEAIDQLLCVNCKRYLADRFVEGGCPHPGCNYEDARGDQCDGCGKLVNAIELRNPRCKVCARTPIVKQSKQYFLDLPKLEPLLLHWIEKACVGWSNNARLIAKSWLKEGLKSRCITRDLKWGIPVPVEEFKEKVFYVWFDAPIGYMSMTYRYAKQWEKWWRPAPDAPVSLYQFMAKDNVPFHSIMFPGMLLGCNKGYVTVSHIMATEYLNYEDGKFSKSRGIGVFGNDAQDTGIPSDVWRFYLLYVRPESQDSSFSWIDLATKNNSELLNNLGNFVNRALVFMEKNFNSTVPEMKPNEEDYRVLALCTRELKGYIAALEKAKLRDGIRHILAISRHGNQYMQSTQPWVLVKGTDTEKERARTVIGICCNLACLLATLLFPYMPESSRIIKKQLNASASTSVLTPSNPKIVTLLPSGHVIGKPAPLFTKIETARVEELKKKFAGKQQTNGNSGGEIIAPADLEDAVEKQGEKVRALKASGAAKTVWQPEVNILLDLKRKLEAARASTALQNGEAAMKPNESEVKELEKAIETQGNVVRKLKESGVPKQEWQPQVDLLLQLKSKLAVATGKPLVTSEKTKKSKK